MRWIAKFSAAALLSLVVLLPAVLLGTSVGARLALQVAGARLPIDSAGVAGSLWQGLALDRFSYIDDELQIRAEQMAIALDWRCAIRGTLCISTLTVMKLSVSLPAADEGRSELPESLPLDGLPRLRLDTVSIAELLFTRGDDRQSISGLELAAQLGPRLISLEGLSLEHAIGAATASVELRRNGDWSLTADMAFDDSFTLSGSESAEEPLVLPRALTLRASGDLRSLVASVDSSAAPELALALEARLGDSMEDVSAEGSLAGLGTLLPLLTRQPWTQLDGPLAFTVRMDGEVQRLGIEQMLAGYAPESLPLRASLQRQGEELTLTQASLGAVERPLLRAIGELGAPAALQPRLQLILLDFVPPAAAELPIEAITGTLSVAASLDAPLDSWVLASRRLLIAEAQNSWELALDLRADGETLFPLGTVQGRRNEQAFSYSRDPTPSAPARLSVLGDLQLGDYTLTDLSLAAVPGDPLALTLNIAGDLAARLELALQRTDEGANLRVQPFDLRLLDETVVSDSLIAGRWDQDAQKLFLDDLCLRWKSNRACSDGLALGETGSLTLDLRVDESYAGDVAEKPFTLSARGEGTLAVTWNPEGAESVDLSVDFSALSFDPYVAQGTAPPIVWEQARARANWSSADLGLVLDLESNTLGDAALELHERDGELLGGLQIESLNMGALNDLVPESTLENGRLRADLRIAGTRAEPAVFGNLDIDQLTARLPGVDTPLDDVRLAIDAQGQRMLITSTAQFGGGPVTLDGLCCEDDALTAKLRGKRNRVVVPAGLDAKLTPELDIRLDRESLSVGGLVTVHDGVFVHSGPLNGGVGLSDDVYRIDLPPEPRRRFVVNAQLRTLIEPGFSLRSRELLATLSGDLRLDLKPEQPAALFGDLQVLGGELRALGQSLRLAEGVVAFVGDPMNPQLTLSAEREIAAENLRVGFRVRGSLEEPSLELFSEPQRSERETLSYLLRGRGPDLGAAADSTAMALSLGASAINQSGLLSSLNDIPGLSGVTLGAEGSDEEMAATISAYVGDRLYLSYGLGIYEPVNALTARLYLRSRLWLEVVSRLESSLDLYYRFDRN